MDGPKASTTPSRKSHEMVKENPERIVTTRLGKFPSLVQSQRACRAEAHTRQTAGGGSSTWRVGAGRCHLISAQLITSHSRISLPPAFRSSLPATTIITSKDFARPERSPPATPHTTPLTLCALVGHSWSAVPTHCCCCYAHEQPNGNLLLALLLPASASGSAQPANHSHSNPSHTHTARFKGLFPLQYSTWYR